ncbi:RNA-binding protein [Plasmodium gonderi]|uniref:RNA-binding protein n=1 Tax=Plasmodium gonderi TaxID=77519 RepID=A0A1Y1JMU7_PLAGO|nr:RNA-binding protein [Plasmodium gonderi]GAW82547.1 RNA-binding protein [Plasmodium gonderi]
MDSLYSDLPPPVSNNSKKIGKNENENNSNENKKNSYIEINKFLITPAIIQKKIANIKNANKELDGDKINKNDEIKGNRKHNNINAGYDSCDSDIYINRDAGNKEDDAAYNSGVPNDMSDKNATDEEEHRGKKGVNNSKDIRNENTDIEKIININKSVQDDLKKISDRLHKIQRSNNKLEPNTNANNMNNQEKFAKMEKIKSIDINLKKAKLYDHNNSSNRNNTFAGEQTNLSSEYFQPELYEKYFIGNANEDYDPNKPNDLNKIIKERKRKKIIMLAAQKKKLEEQQIIETNQMDNKKGVKEYDRKKNYYGYDQKNITTVTNNFTFDSEHANKNFTNSGISLHDEERERNNGLYNQYDRKGRKFVNRRENSQTREGEKETYGYDDKEYVKDIKNNEQFHENSYQNKLSDTNNNDGKRVNKETLNNNNDGVSAIPAKKDFATRMMEKMGWKKGEGLGKDKQGIKAPLILQKVDKRSGVIVQAPDILKKNKSSEGNDEGNSVTNSNVDLLYSNHALTNNTSRIIRLSNLVTKDDVDDSLKEEIEEEASKFGNLLNINIIIDKNLSDAQAVKIFCEYESNEQAQNALNTFRGRTFAGRKVEAIFATEEECQS